MPYLHRAPGPPVHPVPKDARVTHSSGQSFEQLRQGCLQTGSLFEDADFPASNASLFYSERPQVPFVWKRPGVSDVRSGVQGAQQREGGKPRGVGGRRAGRGRLPQVTFRELLKALQCGDKDVMKARDALW
jgi:hypothetical protein